MGALQSNLSAAGYGYDMIVATTQAAINSVFKGYIDGNDMATITKYWAYQADGYQQPYSLQEITEANFLKLSNNTSPFKVDAWDNTKPVTSDITNLQNAFIGLAVQAQPGIPDCVDEMDLTLIQLNYENASADITLMCNTIQVVAAYYESLTPPAVMKSYLGATQDSTPLTITLRVPLQTVASNSNLPDVVQQQVNTLGPNYSVQQLICDFSYAHYVTPMDIPGIDMWWSDIGTNLNNVFGYYYMSAIQSLGALTLGYSITESTVAPSTLTITSEAIMNNAFVNSSGKPESSPTQTEQDLATLNYYYGVNGGTLPAPSQFTWNWLDDNNKDEADFDGVMAINRSRMTSYFKQQLDTFVGANCLLPNVWVDGDMDFAVSLAPNQAPTVTVPSTGSTVLEYAYQSPQSSASFDLDGSTIAEIVSSSYNLTASFTGETIVVVQHLVINVVATAGNTVNVNIIDKIITDTYTLALNDQGVLGFTLANTVVDNSVDPESLNGSFFRITLNALKNQENNFISTSFTAAPLSMSQKFVFPGGRAFSFKDAQFSNNQDLICHITYAD